MTTTNETTTTSAATALRCCLICGSRTEKEPHVVVEFLGIICNTCDEAARARRAACRVQS